MSKKPPAKPQGDDAGKRASDILSAFLSIQSYADDSMFFMGRYYDRAQRTMRQKDYEEFLKAITALSGLWATGNKCAPPVDVNPAGFSPADASTAGESSSSSPRPPPPPAETVAEKAKKMAELRQNAVNSIKDYPELAADFDQFCIASRAAIRASNSQPTK